MKREHVHNFADFLKVFEQGVELGDEGPVETDAEGDGGEGQQANAQAQRLKIAFVPVDKKGMPIYRGKEITFPVYAVYYDKVKEWADKFIEKNKVDDFINMLKIKHDMDTLEEKKMIIDFMEAVKDQRVGDRAGEITVDFTNKGEAVTEDLDVSLIYYDVKRKED